MNLSNRVLSRKIVGAGASLCGCLLLANCMSSNYTGRKVDPKYGVTASPRVVELGQPVPKGGGVYRVGKPYVVAGKTYYPEEDRNYTATGIASWYGADFHGRRTANGEVFDMESITAAHPTMPIPSYARVTNLANNKSLIVRVNDRGPFHANRVMDLSVRSAKLLGFHGNGLAKIKVEYVGRAPIEGSDDRMLVATLSEGRPAPAPSRVMLASAKPFIAEDRPSRLRGDVPVPDSRPYTLGPGSDDTVSEPAPQPAGGGEVADLRSARPLNAQASSFDSRFGQSVAVSDEAMQARPVSAFSSTRSDGAGSVLSGRGLY